MAGDWIKMRSNIDTDYRVIELASMLGIEELHVVGCLWKLWSWADQHTLDGNAIRVTSVTLDRFSGVTGFANSLKNVGWLHGEEGCFSFPNFSEHNGHTAKNRANTSKRVAKHRNASSVTDVTHAALPEKRREEKRRSKDISNETNDTQYSNSFVNFWNAYPANGQKGKLAASKAFAKASKITPLENIMLAVTRYSTSRAVSDGYVKNAATWLNQGCWDDSLTSDTKDSRVATADDLRDYNPNDPRYC